MLKYRSEREIFQEIPSEFMYNISFALIDDFYAELKLRQTATQTDCGNLQAMQIIISSVFLLLVLIEMRAGWLSG